MMRAGYKTHSYKHLDSDGLSCSRHIWLSWGGFEVLLSVLLALLAHNFIPNGPRMRGGMVLEIIFMVISFTI